MMRTFRRYGVKTLAVMISFLLLANTAFALESEAAANEVAADYFHSFQASHGRITPLLETLHVLEPLPGPCQTMVPVMDSAAACLIAYGRGGTGMGAEMSLCGVQSGQLKLLLSNTGTKTFSHTSFPALTRYTDGVWQPCPVTDDGIAEVAMIPYVIPGESKELTYNLSTYYGALPAGDYQAEMRINHFDPFYGPSPKSYSLTCRFSITGEG